MMMKLGLLLLRLALTVVFVAIFTLLDVSALVVASLALVYTLIPNEEA